MPMNTIICGISALRFWRMPPLVSLVMTEPEEEWRHLGFVSCEQMASLREQMMFESKLVIDCGETKRWRSIGEHACDIRSAAALLGQCMEFPIDILVKDASECKRSGILTPRLWSSPVPPGCSVRITDEISVVTPEFALLQLAATLPLNRCLLMASELFGTYSRYNAPRPFTAWLESRAATASGRFLLHGRDGWAPCVIGGKLYDLWKRDSLVSPESLRAVVNRSESTRGSARALKIADLVTPGAASPLESKAGLLLSLPKTYGGLGHTGMAHNHEVRLGRVSRSLAGKQRCFCDLYWGEGVDLEIQSKLAHESETSFLSDSERMAALLNEGVTVLPVTAAQLNDRSRLLEVSNTLAKLRGIEPIRLTPRQEEHSRKLFDDLNGFPGDYLG